MGAGVWISRAMSANASVNMVELGAAAYRGTQRGAKADLNWRNPVPPAFATARRAAQRNTARFGSGHATTAARLTRAIAALRAHINA